MTGDCRQSHARLSATNRGCHRWHLRRCRRLVGFGRPIMRYGTARSKTYFLFNKVGLAGCDMGACALLPRVIGQGRASELLYTGRGLPGEEAERWGFSTALCTPEEVLAEAQAMAKILVERPYLCQRHDQKMLQQEWNMGVDEAIEAEAKPSASAWLTNDFHQGLSRLCG
jgi:enoyl-CoA hydratase/carnithine racemase